MYSARFRRFFHILWHWPSHRAFDDSRAIVFIARESGRSLALNETTSIGCTCGKVFWLKEGEGPIK